MTEDYLLRSAFSERRYIGKKTDLASRFALARVEDDRDR